MTSQPQLSTTPAPADLPEAAVAATQATTLDAPARSTTSAIEPAPVTAPLSRGVFPRLGNPNRRPLLLGLGGALALLFGGLGAGGVLMQDHTLDNTPLVALRFGHGYDLAVLLCYLGLALMIWAWVLLGRDVLSGRAGGRAVLTTATVWTVPMLVTPPLFTRDPYSYLAYGTLPLHGFSPYVYGPSVLSGPIQQNVHWFWQDTPAPYGPLFLAMVKAAASVTGENMVTGVVLIRLAMLVGLILTVAALPGLVRHLGGRVPLALWIGVANPVMVVLLVGGPHNDLLTIGFLAMGTLMVLDRRYALGIALVTLAAAVKATAALALPFLVLVWAARLSGGSRNSRIVRAGAAAVAVFLIAMAACSALAGVGIGWLAAVIAPTSVTNWMSLPTGAGELIYNMVNGLFGGMSETPFTTVTRILAVIVFLVIAVRQWLAARDGGPDAVRRAGWVLLLFVVFSPAVLPWYYSWGMVLLAAKPWSKRALQVIMFVSIFLIIAAFPDGEFALYDFGYLIIMMACAVVACVSLLRPDPLRLGRRRPARPVPADTAVPDVVTAAETVTETAAAGSSTGGPDAEGTGRVTVSG
jgi:alpha-1,6-mannosyltransferase